MKRSSSARSYTFIALMAAVIAVLSLLSIPMPSGVPITLQTFAIALCGFLLGWREGTAAVGVYLALGALGLPIFSGGNGGVQVFVGLTGGFLWGFPLFALLCGLPTKGTPLRFACGVGGLIVCHALGVAQYALLTGNSLWAAMLLVSLPYLIKDVLSVAAALLLASALAARIPALRR